MPRRARRAVRWARKTAWTHEPDSHEGDRMSTTAAEISASEPFRPGAPDYLADPYARLRRLREQGPLYVHPDTGLWFLLRFEDVEAGLTRITRGNKDGNGRHIHFPGNPFAADGPGHTGPRRVIMPTFTNRAVQQFRDRAQQIVDTSLAGKERGGELRVVDEIGFPLPYHLTCDILGVPDVDNVAELRDWTWKSLELIDAFLTPEQLRVNLEASACLAAHLRDVIEWKRDHLADDVVSTVIRAADEGEIMRPEQVVPYVHTLYLAGMHTTVNQTALSLHALLENRDQWELLRDDPALLENAVEELLRFEPTAQYFRRTGTSDHEIGGITIPAGTEVLCWIASANRDEERWGPTVDDLDITREEARHHIAFGKGPHVCVGSWLARLELQVVIGSIVSRFPNTQLPDQELRWASNVIRGPEELVIELRP
jgi:cytochrome P450